MNQLTEQLAMFGLPDDQVRTVQIEPGIVLVEVSPPAMPKQSTVMAANPSKNIKLADKFESMADLMQVQIDAKLNPDRQTNTPKRMREAASARAEGKRLTRTQYILRALARRHRENICPPRLAKLKSKKAVYELMASHWEMGASDYIDTGEPREDASKTGLELWSLLPGNNEEEQRTEKLAQMVRDLQFSKIPGYFPTPPAVIDLMLDYADIESGQCVLEPSAGSGAICDALPDDIGLTCYEIDPRLCEILKLKGYDIHERDFLASTSANWGNRGGMFEFDRVLMNPPFEKLADIDHVTAAFERLRVGGRLVSVMSPGPFFRSDKKCLAFQAWIEETGAEVIALPDNSFKQSGTGVASKLVVIDREA